VVVGVRHSVVLGMEGYDWNGIWFVGVSSGLGRISVTGSQSALGEHI
jgi:hypothetical protein